MTSSWLLSNRKDIGIGRIIGEKGEYNDMYITPGGTRECHPDYEATPINDQKGYGFLLCTRRNPSEPRLGSGVPPKNPIEGVNLQQRDLYRTNKQPIQLFSPLSVQERIIPHEQYLRQHDYYSRDITFDGIGIRSSPTPAELHKYRSDINHPPPKFDIHQLHQRYPVWKQELLNNGESQEHLDNIDRTHNYSIGTGFW